MEIVIFGVMAWFSDMKAEDEVSEDEGASDEGVGSHVVRDAQLLRQLLCVVVEDEGLGVVMGDVRQHVACLLHLIGWQEVQEVEVNVGKVNVANVAQLAHVSVRGDILCKPSVLSVPLINGRPGAFVCGLLTLLIQALALVFLFHLT